MNVVLVVPLGVDDPVKDLKNCEGYSYTMRVK